MFSCRIGSFNELEQQRGSRNWKRWLGNHDLPSADELAYVSEKIDTDDLRCCMANIYSRLKRNKILLPTNGFMVAAVDGHEMGWSYHRASENCLEREIEVGGETRIQYYNRFVAFQIITSDFQFCLDVELQLPGEDEVATSMRLLERVIGNHPRCFDVLLADAIYLRPSMITFLRQRDKHLIVVLKKNQPELLQEAKTLMTPLEPTQFFTEKKSSHHKKDIYLRDMEGFTTDTITEPLRVVWANEQTEKRERINKQWHVKQTETDWFWATTMEQSLAGEKVIHKFGHNRWKIENEGFNELVTHWNADHYFHHHPNSIEALCLILFMAYAVFHCFYLGNLKPEVKIGHTVIFFAHQLSAGQRTENWWPPPV